MKRKFVISAVLAVTFIVGAAIGTTGQSPAHTIVRTHTVTDITPPAPPEIQYRTKTKVVHAKPRVITRTVTVHDQTPTPAATPAAAPASGGQTFTGNGSQGIGTIHVATDSTLHWTCPSCTETGMLIIGEGAGLGDMDIDQTATSGSSQVSADTYSDVKVDADGPFTITITPNN